MSTTLNSIRDKSYHRKQVDYDDFIPIVKKVQESSKDLESLCEVVNNAPLIFEFIFTYLKVLINGEDVDLLVELKVI